MILLPYLIANVIVALVWFWMLDYQIGHRQPVPGWIGLEPHRLLRQRRTGPFRPSPLVNVWRHMGYTALLIFAGLQTIPPHVYEAAALDGAPSGRSFWRITLPLLRPILALVLVVTVIGSFQVFDTVAVTTKGGPVNASSVIQYYIYEQAFTRSPLRLRPRAVARPVRHPRRWSPSSSCGCSRPRVGSGLEEPP